MTLQQNHGSEDDVSLNSNGKSQPLIRHIGDALFALSSRLGESSRAVEANREPKAQPKTEAKAKMVEALEKDVPDIAQEFDLSEDEATRDQAGTGRATAKRIGEVLIELGFVTREQIETVLKDSAGQSMQLGKRLLKAGIIDDVKLARALSVHLGVGFSDLSRSSDIDPVAVSKVPEHLARRYMLLPIQLEGKALTVAMASPGNVFAIDAVRAATGLHVHVVAAPANVLRKAIERSHAFDINLEDSVSQLKADGQEEAAENLDNDMDLGQLRTEAADAPVVKYVDNLISQAIRDRASDIHIEPSRNKVTVRMRIDGRLRPTSAPPKSMQNAVVSRIKILASLDIAEKRLPLDGRLHVMFQGRSVDLRLSTLPTIHGEKVVMRVLDKDAVRMELGSLGFDADFLKHLKTILTRPNGIILVTGPTGSGKTTTLYGCLNHVRNVAKNVITVEDPVEYEVGGVTQVAVRSDIGLDFARILRSILRQDPDIIMVGEMRDLETLDIGIRASLTGHLVLSTLHTNDAVSSISRMINMGAEPYLIASTVITAMAQRLVRCICNECKEEYEVDDAIRERIAEGHGVELPRKLWRGAGCPLCSNTGYLGRSAIFEYFHVDSDARKLISMGAPEEELREHQRLHSSGSLFDNALHKAITGVTTVDEALRFDISSA